MCHPAAGRKKPDTPTGLQRGNSRKGGREPEKQDHDIPFSKTNIVFAWIRMPKIRSDVAMDPLKGSSCYIWHHVMNIISPENTAFLITIIKIIHPNCRIIINMHGLMVTVSYSVCVGV